MIEPFMIMTFLCIGACFYFILKHDSEIKSLEDTVKKLKEEVESYLDK